MGLLWFRVVGSWSIQPRSPQLPCGDLLLRRAFGLPLVTGVFSLAPLRFPRYNLKRCRACVVWQS